MEPIDQPDTSAPAPSTPVQEMDAAEASIPRSRVQTIAVLIALFLTLFVAALEQTIMATSIPTICAQLHSAAGYFWIGGAFLLANCAAGPIWAKCSDIWGRKPAALAAVAMFAVWSVLGALSTSMPMLIAARALQGTAGGALMSLVYITISDLFSVRDRALYLGMLNGIWAIAGGTGPMIGGALTEYVSWRWTFWINIPFCAVSFALLLFFLDVHNPRTRLWDGILAVDWFGTISLVGVTLMLLLGLDFGGTAFAWSSPKVICLIIFGSVMVLCFVLIESRLAKYPLMPLSIFKDRSNIVLFVVAFAHGFSYIGPEYYLPLYFQSVKQASPLFSGILIIPYTISASLMGIASGVTINRTGRYRELTWAGLVLLTLGLGLYIELGSRTPIVDIVFFEIVAGAGTGMLFEAPLIAIQNTVSQADMASTSATYTLIRNIAVLMSVVLGGVVFQNGMSEKTGILRASGLPETVVDMFSGSRAAANADRIGAIQDQTQRMIVKNVFSASFRNMWIMYTCAAAIGLLASVLVAPKKLRTEHAETKTGLSTLTERMTDQAK